MKSILQATAVLSASSLVSIALGLVSAKAWATLVGAEGIGYLGLLQSLTGIAGMVAALGIGPGLVRAGAAAISRNDSLDLAALRRAAWVLFWAPGGAVMILLVLFRDPISRIALDRPGDGWAVSLMGIAVLLNLANAVQTSLLNAHHQVAALAKVGVLNSVFSVVLGVLIAWRIGEQGIPYVVVVIALAGVFISRIYLHRAVPADIEAPPWGEVLKRVKTMIRFGVPYSASMIVGSGVQLTLPFLVVHQLGQSDVGYYRAAVTVSVTYLGFLISAMAQDYFPRLSAAVDDPAKLAAIANQQFRLVMLIATPMVLGVLALSPYLVPLVYTRAFSPTSELLEWQLIGDIFKFASWTIAFIILVATGSSTYFLCESIGGGVTLLASWLGLHWFGLNGLGIAFLGAYTVYFALVWIVSYRKVGFVLSNENIILLVGAVLAALVVRILPFVGLDTARTPVALTLACLAGLLALRHFWIEIDGRALLQRRWT